jgi:hypothetical protein
MKYNNINVPIIIRCDRIISAFENEIDNDKIEDFMLTLSSEMLSHDFPPILGYPVIIAEEEIGKFFLGEYYSEVTEEHIGQLAWMVTDGHHRSIAAANIKLPHLPVMLDRSCITNEADLKQFDSCH